MNQTTVIYGQNFTVLTLSVTGHTRRQPLVANVFTPDGDTDKKRPLIIYLKTGNFLPFPQNNSCGGKITDSAAVEFATRLTKMGYVVAVADYRLGWNPLAPQELTRRFTLINAAYRGVQDVRTAIRYFRRSVAEQSNPFGIDPEKIVVWGQGTGGYLSMATAYLNQYNEILTTSDPNKYKLGGLPMVIEAYNGNINGTSGPCLVDATYNAATGIPTGDTLCVPNHVGYPSGFQLAVNMGGALGDSTWMDAGEAPLISYHVPSDFFAPCGTDILNVPAPGGPQPVVEVSGSCDMQKQADKLGINNVFSEAAIKAANLQLYDKYGATARARSGGRTGFLPFIGTPNNSSSPWEWTSYTGTEKPVPTDCNINFVSSRAYIDTIIGYFAPRAVLALKLTPVVNTEDIIKNIEIEVAPNPATAQTVFTVPAELPIKALDVYDANGRLVRNIRGINSSVYTLQRDGMPRGLYIVKVYFDEGITSRKVMFE